MSDPDQPAPRRGGDAEGEITEQIPLWRDEVSEPTAVLPTWGSPQASAPTQPPVPAPPTAPPTVPPPVAAPDRARPDVRTTPEWELALARLRNRSSTDLGLLLLRLGVLPLVLHGVHAFWRFDAHLDAVRAGPLGGVAPTLVAIVIAAAYILIPAFLALGFATRPAGLALAVLMGLIVGLDAWSDGAVFDAASGTLVAEAGVLFGVIGLVLTFTGAGRFSLDDALAAQRRERRVERRLEKRLFG